VALEEAPADGGLRSKKQSVAVA